MIPVRLNNFLNRYGIYFLSLIFFILYATLGIVRHNHFLSAWDLSVVDQITWKYSQFLTPITTVHAYSGTLIFTDHVEFIYVLLSPLYWIWNDARALITAQAFFISFSAVPIYLLAVKYKIKPLLALTISPTYLLFYGVQTALWNDVHSIVFGASFIAWFIYLLDSKKIKLTFLAFLLAIACKEDVAFLTLAISFAYFIKRKDRQTLILITISIIYLFAVFFIYYPHFTSGYRFEDQSGYFKGFDVGNYFNTADKQQSIFFSLAGFGFIPLLAPLFLIPAFADISHYFILGSTVTTAQGIFLHYRVTLAPLLALPTIIAISKYKKLNRSYTGIYLIICSLAILYYLHLPLTYLTKQWFWTTPPSVSSINLLIKQIPSNASLVSEVNIIPHVDHRNEIYTLWAEEKTFKSNSPCGQRTCPWFRWNGNPQYLIVNTAPNWDIRQLFQNNPDFNSAINSIEKEGVVKLYKQEGTTELYKILKNPKVLQ